MKNNSFTLDSIQNRINDVIQNLYSVKKQDLGIRNRSYEYHFCSPGEDNSLHLFTWEEVGADIEKSINVGNLTLDFNEGRIVGIELLDIEEDFIDEEFRKGTCENPEKKKIECKSKSKDENIQESLESLHNLSAEISEKSRNGFQIKKTGEDNIYVLEASDTVQNKIERMSEKYEVSTEEIIAEFSSIGSDERELAVKGLFADGKIDVEKIEEKFEEEEVQKMKELRKEIIERDQK